jgi:hypothetical protein
MFSLRLVSRICAALALVLAWTVATPSLAVGQSSTGGIRGIVEDGSGGVMAGVTVEAASPARIGGPAVTVTNSEGLYVLENLPIGTYVVTFTLQGFSPLTRDGVRIEVGRSIELPATLSVGGLEQAVTVTGAAPVVDTVHAGYTTNFNQQMLENVPTARSSWFDVVTAAPAVRSDPVSANSATFLLYGASGDQNSYQNDGVEIAAPSGGTVWSFPNPDTIAEVQVVGVGASAEYSGFQGGVVNIVTKSGSNALTGTASYFYGGNGLTGSNTPDEEFPYHIDYQSDATFSLGGPIRRDRLWVLGMVEFNNTRTSDVGVDPATAPKNHNYKPFAKITGRLSGNDAFEFQYSDEYFTLPEPVDFLNPADTVRDEHGRNPIVVGRYTHTFGARTLFEARGGGIYIRDNFDPHSGDFATPGRVDNDTGLASANTSSTITKQTQNQTSLSANVSRGLDGFITGTHELKGGLQYSQGTNLTNSGLPGGVSYLDFGDDPGEATFRTTSSTIGSVKTFGVFAQDNWTIKQLTLNLGVRFDRSTGNIPETDQLDPTFENVVGSYPGVPDVITYDNVSPRLGFAYKLDRDAKTVLKGSYGRYYARLNTGLFTAIAPGSAVTTTFGFNPATGQYDRLLSTSDPKLNNTIDPDLKNQFDDQFSLGIERELLPDLGVNATFIAKAGDDFIRGQDFGSVYAPRVVTDTFDGVTRQLTVFNRTTPAARALIGPTNRSDFKQTYRSVVTQAYKRLSQRWQLQASYQWERSKGYSSGNIAGGTTIQNGAGTFGADPNQLVNAYGRFSTDSTHSVRVSSNVELPYAIQLAVRSVYESGRPYGRLITVRGLSQGNTTVIAEPRGSFQLPSRNDIGIRLGKDFRMERGRMIRLSCDIQNILNRSTPLALNNNSSQASYGETTQIFLPRRALLGLRVTF